MAFSGVPTEKEIKEGSSFPTFDDGSYVVTHIEWFDDKKHTDDGEPIYVGQQGMLVARCRFIVEGKDSGPSYSASIGEILPITRAFGVNVEKADWPDRDKDSSKFLRAVERAIKKAGNTITIQVKGNWVQYGPWGLPKNQEFCFVFDGCLTQDSDGVVSWIDMKYGKTAIFGFRVIGDLDMDPTPYDGFVQKVFVPYGITISTNDPSQPEFEMEDGSYTLKARTCAGLINVMIPSSDPDENSPLLQNDKWEDASNIVPEWVSFAKQANIILKAKTVWSKDAGEVRVYPNSFSIRYKDKRSYQQTEKPKKEAPEQPSVDVEDETKEFEASEAILYLYNAITQEVQKETGNEDAKGFGTDGKLNKAGKKVAGKYLRPLVEGKKITTAHFDKMVDQDIVLCLEAMNRNDFAKAVRYQFMGEEVEEDTGDF